MYHLVSLYDLVLILIFVTSEVKDSDDVEGNSPQEIRIRLFSVDLYMSCHLITRYLRGGSCGFSSDMFLVYHFDAF